MTSYDDGSLNCQSSLYVVFEKSFPGMAQTVHRVFTRIAFKISPGNIRFEISPRLIWIKTSWFFMGKKIFQLEGRSRAGPLKLMPLLPGGEKRAIKWSEMRCQVISYETPCRAVPRWPLSPRGGNSDGEKEEEIPRRWRQQTYEASCQVIYSRCMRSSFSLSRSHRFLSAFFLSSYSPLLLGWELNRNIENAWNLR